MQALIIGFVIICMGMLLFNVAYVYVSSRKRLSNARLTERYEDAVLNELAELRNGGSVSAGHCQLLLRKLPTLKHMLAFENAFHKLQEVQAPYLEAYLNDIYPVFVSLSEDYLEKGKNVKMAYFAHILEELRLCTPGHDAISRRMVELSKDESLYCRENAFRALCGADNVQAVVQALKKISGRREFINIRLVTEDMMLLKHGEEELCGILYAEFNSFSDPLKVAVLNYFRLSGALDCEKIIAIYEKETDMEVRLACLRCFSRYICPQAQEILMKHLEDYNQDVWEYASTAAYSLVNYQGEAVLSMLKEALHSRHWHVRYNAAQSLASKGIVCDDAPDIMNGDDQYAKEMLDYHVKLRQEKELVSVGG